MRFKYGRKLIGDRTTKSRPSVAKATESQFADDTATYATSCDAFKNSATELVHTVERLGNDGQY